MSEGSAPGKLSVLWATEALDILHCIDRYLATRKVDVKRLRPPLTGFRLRCGDYRVFFKQAGEHGIAITGVRHRRDAYR